MQVKTALSITEAIASSCLNAATALGGRAAVQTVRRTAGALPANADAPALGAADRAQLALARVRLVVAAAHRRRRRRHDDVTMTSSAAGPLRPDFGSSRSWAAGDVRQRPTDRPEADGAAAATSLDDVTMTSQCATQRHVARPSASTKHSAPNAQNLRVHESAARHTAGRAEPDS